MLAFHNEHIASCAFLTYFTPDSTTASTSPTALTTTAAAASILNDKQALTGILLKAKNMTNLTQRKRPYISRVPVSTMALMNSLPCWFQGNKTNSKDSLTPVLIDLSKTHSNVIRQHHRERCEAAAHLCDFSLNNTTLNTTLNKRNNINKQHQCSSDNHNKTSVSKL